MTRNHTTIMKPLIKGSEYRKRLLETRTFIDLGNGKVEAKLNCDKNCKDCLLLTDKNECVYTRQDRWQKWATKQRKERMKELKIFDD